MDLKLLEYPRHLHGPGMAYTIVQSVAEAERAIANGWSVDLVPDSPVIPVIPDSPVMPADPLKRGPGRPKKLP